MRFLRKVYLTLGMQFVNCFILFLVAFYSKDYRNFIFNNGYLYLTSILGFIVLTFILYSFSKLRKPPYNIFFLPIMNILLAYSTSVFGDAESPGIIFSSFLTIIFYYIGCFLFTFQYEKIFIHTTQLFYLGGIALIIYPSCSGWPRSEVANIIVIFGSMGAVMIYSILSILSCELILDAFSPEDSIFEATISVYTCIAGITHALVASLQEFCTEKACCKK